MSELNLRPYQKQCLDDIKKYIDIGVNRQLIVWPTGSGKGSLIAWIPQTLGMKNGEQFAVFVHRNDLVTQTAKRIQRYNKNLIVDVEQGDSRANKYADVIVASIQSISRENRLHRFNPATFRYVFVDEAHVIPGSNQYLKTLQYFGALKDTPEFDATKYVFGCTATPDRPDGKGLDFVFDEITYSVDILELMKTGIAHQGKLLTYLAELKAFSVKTEVDLDDIKQKGGDFDLAELEKKVNNPIRNQQVVDSYKKHGEDKPAICFTVDIQHAIDVVAKFKENGLPAEYVTGDTPPEQRQILYNQLQTGKLKCLASAGVLNIGLDLPEATVALMARPTKSGLLFRQSLGRVLRPHPAPEEIVSGAPYEWRKEYAIVIDFVDVTQRHRIITTPTLLGLKPSFNSKGKKFTEIDEAIEKAKDKKKIGNFEKFDNLESIKTFTERIDLMAVPETPKELQKLSNLVWVPDSSGYFLPLPEGQCLSIKKNQLGHFDTYKSVNGVRSYLHTHPTLKDAVNKAECCISPDSMILLKRDVKWRHDEISDKQYNKIASLNWRLRRQFSSQGDFRNYIKSQFKDKGGASAYISQLLADNGK